MCLVINLVRFDNLTGFGVSAYLDDNWPRIMKLIDMVQFDTGITACFGGKYVADAPISQSFDTIECPKYDAYGTDVRPQDYIALLWELKGNGALEDDETIYGCINPECSAALKTGLVVKQSLLIICMLGIAFFHSFAIGLASRTMVYDLHYKSLLLNILVFIFLVGVIVGGVFITVNTDFNAIEVNPESLWTRNKDF